MKTFTVPNLLWYGNEPRRLEFPDRWDIDVLDCPGFKKPALDEAGIRKAFDSPVGSPTLAELAEGRSEVAVVFDDISRPTPVSALLAGVLEPLHEAGIPAENIRFIPALGMHGAMHNIDYRKKLGEETVRNYPIFNHNPYENCDYLGDSPSGIPVYINREFMSCDLRIGIGSITPHIHVGFGGGGKIVLPGICGHETIKAFHREVPARGFETIGLGKFDGNVMYKEIVDVARMSGLQFKVDALLNDRGEVTDVFTGDPVESHLAGVEAGKEHYGTPLKTGKDVVVVNSYGKYNEMGICMMMALTCVNFEAGTIVLLVDSPEGQVCHYLMRSFGKEYGGASYIKRGPVPETINGIVCSAYPDMTMCDWFASADSVTVTSDWEATLPLLEELYPDGASVAVIPDGTMQYFKEA
ncbi:MAG TPA: lactate racemase domain-containing protein [Candidatus Anoxymicrobiaceae bacterium]